jgi:hypothetical protein
MIFDNGLSGSPMWEQNLQSLLNNYPHVIMTLNGHTDIDPTSDVHDVVNGRAQIEFDRQTAENEKGACSVRIYSFDLNAQAVSVSTYVVWNSTWLVSTQDSFSFSTNLVSIPTVSVTPTQVRLGLGQSQMFSSSVSGGRSPYFYQWYLNDSAVSGATGQNWTFTPSVTGNYSARAKVSDANGKTAQSNIINDFIVYDQSQPDLLVPDWSNVTRDFFTVIPGTADPVLTAADVTDRAADFVADPFIYHENGLWYMFFEVHWASQDYSEIGLATSNDGFDWSYGQIVLSEPFSLAYPYIFKWDGSYYLIPETFSESEVRLYKATDFPYSWTYVSSILSNQGYAPVDSSVFRYNNMWWMFTSSESTAGFLYYSNNLEDPSAWHMHPMSPINTDINKVRGAGRTIVFANDHIIRLTQEWYGHGVRAFQVDTLNTSAYSEHEVVGSPLVEATGASGWNAQAMHTVNPWWSGNGWVDAVDGAGYDWLWAIGIYMSPLQPSISPTTVRIDLGQSQQFTSIAGGGRPPYSYQWYRNGTIVPGATGQNWTFTPSATGHYRVYVNITDSLNSKVQSNIVTDIIVYPSLTTSISPAIVNLTVGNTQQFNSTVSGGLAPYTYQWYYTNNTAITGATTSTLTYKANLTGTYNIYLNVTDKLSNKVKSNTATLNIYSQPTVTISPVSVNIAFGGSQTFTSAVSGGVLPYTYRWYLNGSAVAGANSDSYVFAPRANGNYQIYVNVTDSLGSQSKSNVAGGVNVSSAYLLLDTDPQATYSVGQQVAFEVTVLNQQNPRLETSLALTVMGPGGYSYYDFQPINVSANGSGEYTFTWVVPSSVGAYVVTANLAPAQLTAYDAKWLEVGELPTGFARSSGDSLVISNNLLSEACAFFVPIESQALSVVCCLVLLRYQGKKPRKFSSAPRFLARNMVFQREGVGFRSACLSLDVKSVRRRFFVARMLVPKFVIR